MGLLSRSQREAIIDQALELIEKLYVHLPLKRAMHAVDPIQRLRLLRHRSAALSEPLFHAELLSIFNSLRDLHTNYILPEPLRGKIAYLPFRIEDYFEGKARRYLVSSVMDGVQNATFGPGAEVTHWNGVPIDRAVAVNADREAGSNPEARHACGLAAMTIRPLALSLPPDEQWVDIRYIYKRAAREKRFVWKMFESSQSAAAGGPLAQSGESANAIGLDARAELERQARRLLYRPESVAIERLVRKEGAAAGQSHPMTAVDYSAISKIPGVFTFSPIRTASGTFAYIRIHTFLVPEYETVDSFVAEFVRILGLLPQNGLILDVRGNPGGHITAAERLLQLFTPRPIEPERFALIVSPLTRRLCESVPWLEPWKDSIIEAVETGAAFSQAFPLVPPSFCNDIGQKYQGPVVLLTNARCYSATDIFSAGFQDHEIGTILGASAATGAGGANVWDHEFLCTLLPADESPFQPLPNHASFRIAVRRCTRVAARAGTLIEDLGVKPDILHQRTRDDVLKSDVDMIRRAAKILQDQHKNNSVSFLQAEIQDPGPPTRLSVRARNLSRLDVFLNDRPQQSVDLASASTVLEIPRPRSGTRAIELRGYRGDRLAVSSRIRL
jgi:C-terminal processing protease CtpA/Prc